MTFRRGVVDTPAFMPVGTYGTVKAMTPEELEGSGAQIILGNTFHLLLRPGMEVIRAHGGLHTFMHWERPILTDSGGFQVWSLQDLRKISEKGVAFRSPVNGDLIELTPERSIEMQDALGADIVMVFDECTPYPAEHEAARESMELSLRWARRSRAAFDELKRGRDSDAALFGIVQGGVHETCAASRSRACRRSTSPATRSADSPSASRGRAARRARGLGAALPADRPRYLMGVGTPADFVEGRRARHGHVRLRDADAERAQRPALHERRAAEHPQQPLPSRHGPDRPALRLLRVPALFARLPAASPAVQRDPGRAARDDPQPPLLPG